MKYSNIKRAFILTNDIILDAPAVSAISDLWEKILHSHWIAYKVHKYKKWIPVNSIVNFLREKKNGLLFFQAMTSWHSECQ